ncbi:MAG: arsenate reductase family protein [Balneolaceae bacterium]
MITLYGIKNCNKIRDAKSWLEHNGVGYIFVDLKKEPLGREELAEAVRKVGLDVLINKRGMKWRQLGLAKQELSEEELFEQLLEHQTMIKRPLLIDGEAILVGYDEDAFEDFVA